MIYRKRTGAWCVRDDRGFRKFATEKDAQEYAGISLEEEECTEETTSPWTFEQD